MKIRKVAEGSWGSSEVEEEALVEQTFIFSKKLIEKYSTDRPYVVVLKRRWIETNTAGKVKKSNWETQQIGRFYGTKEEAQEALKKWIKA